MELPKVPTLKLPELILLALRLGILEVASSPDRLKAAPVVAMVARPLIDAAVTDPVGKDTDPEAIDRPFAVSIPDTVVLNDIVATIAF